jgi:hypothetical protein
MTYESIDREEIKPQWRARLEDPLSASTRAKRRLLLVTSTVSLVIVILGLFPTKIEALGIAFESGNKRDLLVLLAVVNAYGLVGFCLYAWADVQLQQRIQSSATAGYINEFIRGQASVAESFTYFFRLCFDFAVPIVYGTYALYRLWDVM